MAALDAVRRSTGAGGTALSYDRVVGLFVEHRLGLVRLAVLLVDDLASAEDVVQDAFIALHRRALRDEDAALGYLRAAVLNGARDMIRRRQTARRGIQPIAAQLQDIPSADARYLRAETQDEVLAALRALPPRQQEVLVLRYWCDLSEQAIADALGISRGTVKSTASKAMDRLSTLLAGAR